MLLNGRGYKRGMILAAAVALAAPTIAMGGTIANTPHDLSSVSTGPNKSATQSDTCVFCHVAHNGSPGANRPLWSHNMTSTNLAWTPTTTVRGTTIPYIITSVQLQGSRGCMSCHDGTIAMGDLINGVGGTVAGANLTAGKLTTGINLLAPASMQTNHPLGVSMPATVAGFTAYKTVPPGTAVNYDANGYVQCDSCHNPHDDSNTKFLKINPAGGAICLTCHNV